MSDGHYLIDTRKFGTRALLALTILAALVFAWFSVKLQIGSMLAELTTPSRAEANLLSKYATALAPLDPQAWWLAATTEKDLFTPEKIDASVRMLEQAVRVAPHDFRWWIELAREYEQSGDTSRAEAAFRKAVYLAPAYVYPHWQLGNFLIRQGRAEEAIDELKWTTENNVIYRDQAFALVWNYFGNDVSRVEQLADDRPDVKAGLAYFFAAHDRPEDSLRIWNTLSKNEKTIENRTARGIAEAMLEKRAFWEGVEFAKQSGIDSNASIEAITNSGFESTIVPVNDTIFGWKIDRADAKAENSADPSVRRSGIRSLRTVFRNYVKPTFYGIWQNVAVKPNTHYILRLWVRTENLKSGGPPLIEVVNASDDKGIAVSKPFPTGTNDWSEVTVEFTTPEICGGIFIRTSRESCGENCPLTGTMWLDDFELLRP